MMAKASSNRSTRWSNGNPNARYSGSFHPAPSPRINRPPLISSMVAAFLARMAGLWNETLATSGPRSTRSVMPASAARTDQASHGPRGGRSGPGNGRWPPPPSESTPACSAARAMSRNSGQRTSRSTSGSWTPTFSGRFISVDPSWSSSLTAQLQSNRWTGRFSLGVGGVSQVVKGTMRYRHAVLRRVNVISPSRPTFDTSRTWGAHRLRQILGLTLVGFVLAAAISFASAQAGPLFTAALEQDTAGAGGAALALAPEEGFRVNGARAEEAPSPAVVVAQTPPLPGPAVTSDAAAVIIGETLLNERAWSGGYPTMVEG